LLSGGVGDDIRSLEHEKSFPAKSHPPGQWSPRLMKEPKTEKARLLRKAELQDCSMDDFSQKPAFED
jgi:hypothetical protein